MIRPQTVIVNDRMQHGYRYQITEPEGRNFDPEFRPELSPKEMLALGVFVGKYMTDCRGEFPAEWFDHARLSPGRRDKSLNYFRVDASQPLSVWRAKGWIHPDDPRGWFQWYCRYYRGRRMADDARQVALEGDPPPCPPDREELRPMRLFLPPATAPGLLHWAYDSRRI